MYSPRFGRTYLFAADSATNAVLPALLGLRAATYRGSLTDPAERVELTDCAEPDEAEPGRFLVVLYVFFHSHRTIVSIDRGIRLAKWLARLSHARQRWGPRDVGRIVMAVERAVGISDCYPRALLSAYLCMTARLSCAVTVGILAPTAKMHAWCSVGGSIPYEPKPEHWFYSPLAVFDVVA